MNLKDKRVLCYDHGLWPSLAERLSQSFGHVDYFCSWKSVAPKLSSYLIGTGLENVRRVKSFWDAVPDADLIVFADVNDGDLQQYLADQGKPVWGCMRADELEIYRWEARQAFRKAGIEVPNGVLVTGLETLREHLQEVEDKWIKISVWRGDCETFHHETYKVSETILDDLRTKWGPAADQMEFIVDDPIEDAVEYGYDGGFYRGQWWSMCMYGPEIKDGGYVGKVVENDALPEPLLEVNEKLAPILEKYGYNGFLSTEVRIQKSGPPILMELTCRAPSPPGELALCMWTNLPEMIAGATIGPDVVVPEPKAPYGAELMLYSDWSDDHWTGLDIPKDERQNVKLCFSGNIKGDPQIIPQRIGWGKAGGVIGFGKSVKAACRDCSERAQTIKGKGLECGLEALDKAAEVIAEGKAYGIPF